MPKIISNKSNVDLDYPVVRPSLDLDFTQEELDPRITFSRGSIGTRVNRNRLIETVAANQPRFDYDPVTGECKGLLIEESRTNLVVNSNSFSTLFTNITSNVLISPDGTLNASKNYERTVNDYMFLNIEYTAVAGTTYTCSTFIKAGERKTMYFKCTQSGGLVNTGFFFDMITGAITGVFGSPTSYGAIKYPNGWWRIYCTIVPTTTTGLIQLFLRNDTSGSLIYQGDGTSGYYVYGVQAEAGAFPTSYIPTTASTVTRSADLASMTGTNFSSWYNQTEGTLYASLNNITTRTSITFDRLVALVGTDVNRDLISICTQTASGGGAQNKFLAGVSYSPDGSYVLDTFTGAVSGGGGPDRIGKAIIAYKKDNFAFTVNGITPLRDIGGDIPICNRLLIFGSARFQPAPSGTISRLTYYPRALKPNQLQFLTQ